MATSRSRAKEPLKQALEQQAATAEILKLISASPSDTRPVFQAIVQAAARLFTGGNASIVMREGDLLYRKARAGPHAADDDAMAKLFPLKFDPKTSIISRTIASRRVSEVPDVEKGRLTQYQMQVARAGKMGSFVLVPLLRAGKGIGTLSISYPERGRRLDRRELGVLRTFADQAVIAIENARLFNETKEALERQTATTEILRVIASSPGDSQPVFDAIAKAAQKLFAARYAVVARRVGDELHLAAHTMAGKREDASLRRFFPARITGQGALGKAVLTGKPAVIEDVETDPAYSEDFRKGARERGFRSLLAVPMIRDGVSIGAITVSRTEPGSFSEHQIDLLETFAEQAAIAIENARLFNETKEALERQTATADILRVIASTPTDTHPVFDAIVNAASRLIRGKRTGLLLRRGDHFIAVANSGERIIEDLPADVRTVPLDPDHNFPSRVILNREVLHISDWLGDEVPEFEKGVAKAWGIRSGVMVPLVRGGEGIGALAVTRDKIDIYHQKEIELLRSFADQAVIAIENARLFNETKEALERQTATGEILKVISSSPTDTKPVFDAIASNAARLCEADNLGVFRVEGNELRMVGYSGTAPHARDVGDKFALTRGSLAGRAILEKRTIHIHDLAAEPDEEWQQAKVAQKVIGHRTALAVPLMRDGVALGAIFTRRMEVRPFSDKHIELLRSFADQAVIAIENARLFNETKEALEQQTASADILKVISASPTSVEPVFQAIARNAVQLCDAVFCNVLRLDGELLHVAAHHGFDQRFIERLHSVYPMKPDPSQISGRVIAQKAVVHIEDATVDERYDRDYAAAGGWRRMLGVPMMREARPLGVIVVAWKDVGGTPEGQVRLLQTFADQAAIAIDNVRLFNETKEALEQQTATTEILKVISDSPTSTQPVFQAIAERAARICDASDARIHLLDGANLRLVAGFGDVPAPELGTLRAVEPGLAIGRAVLEGKPVHVDDVRAVAEEFPTASKYGAQFGWRTVLAVPLIREERALGAISLRRAEVRPFDDRQIALLKIFADQAAIAIENVRLFNETKEALERQTATAEILKVISRSPTDVQPVFDAVAQRAAQLCNAAQASVFMAEGDVLRRVAAVGQPSPIKELPIVRGLIYGRAFLECRAVHVEDVVAALDEYPDARDNQRNTGFRTLLAVPMLREGKAIGTIGAWHREVKPFSREQIELLETFAAQAVIAIENVRLFNETKEALERQTATADILGVIAASPSNVQPVFEAIVRHAGRLAAGSSVNVSRVVGDEVHLAAYTRVSETADELLKGLYPFRISSSYAMEQAVTTRAPTFVADFETDPRITDQSRAVMRARGFRSTLYVPIVQGDVVHGLMHVSKVEPGPFPQKWIDLLKTFADQAAIAIENVRLFNATQEALEQQTATTEVLNVISSSITDARPVFDAIARSVLKLYGARNVGLVVRAGDTIDRVGYAVSESSADDGTQALYPIPLDERSLSGRAILRGEVIHIRDVETEEGLSDHSRAITRKTGARSVLIAPMYSLGTATGALAVARRSPGGFSDREVEMIRTFADQGVIAMENVRLFREIEEKSKQLEEASEHKSQFLASMSHELRTPLNALLGFNEMILGDIYGEVPGDMRPPLLQMQASGKHLLRLINNVLDLAKIEAGRMELALADYSVHEVVESVRSTLRPLAQEKGLDFVAELAADLPLARGDAGRITQCLMNLAGNSLKFTKTGKVQISVAADNGLLRYRVADTGIGIPSDKINGLFTEFKQTDATVASEYGGTGLGLAISKKFVEMHGGRIWVESEPGRGSVFTFEVPLRAAAQ